MFGVRTGDLRRGVLGSSSQKTKGTRRVGWVAGTRWVWGPAGRSEAHRMPAGNTTAGGGTRFNRAITIWGQLHLGTGGRGLKSAGGLCHSKCSAYVGLLVHQLSV